MARTVPCLLGGASSRRYENQERYLRRRPARRTGEAVKKYLLLFHDDWDPKPEVMDAWQAWFARVGDRFIDSGTPLRTGTEVTRGRVS